MTMDDLDLDTSIECSHRCNIYPHDDTLDMDTFNSSQIMENNTSPDVASPSVNDNDINLDLLKGDAAKGIAEESFDLSAFIVKYKEDGYLDILNEVSSEEEDNGHGHNQKHDQMFGDSHGIDDQNPATANLMAGFKIGIEKRDEQIQLLLTNMEDMVHEKEEREKDSLGLLQKIELLEAEIKRFAENSEVEQDRYGPSEMSSYLSLPSNLQPQFTSTPSPNVTVQATQTISSAYVDVGSQQHPSIVHKAIQIELPKVISISQQNQTDDIPLPLKIDRECQWLCSSNEMATQFEPSSSNAQVQAQPFLSDVGVQFQLRIDTKVAETQADVPKPLNHVSTETTPLPVYLSSSSQVDIQKFSNEFAQTELKDLIDVQTQYEFKLVEVGQQTEVLNDDREKGKTLHVAVRSLQGNLEALRTLIEDEVNEFRPNLMEFHQILKTILAKGKSEIDALVIQNEKQLKLKSEIETQLKSQIDELKFASVEDLEKKNEEILELKIKVAQLEYSKKSSEAKLMSFSSRMSPEGSELDLDVSLSDTTSQQLSVSQENHLVRVIEEVPHQTIIKDTARPNLEYLRLTPPFDIVDEDQALISTSLGLPSVIEDFKLQLADLEKKYVANLKYLEEQTTEREHERDEFQRQTLEFERRLNEMQRERDRFEELTLNRKMEIEDLEQKLVDTEECEVQLIKNTEKVEDELKVAVEKIYELREIIRELEEQIDASTVDVKDLKEQNDEFKEEIERLIVLRNEAEERLLNSSAETFATAGAEFPHDEIHAQVKELAERLQRKLGDLDNFKWSSSTSRPGSGCSGLMSVSSEDVSVRESGQFDFERELTGLDLADAIRRLDVHFDSFVKFEEIIVKKLRDTEIHLNQTLKRQAELELEKVGSQEKLKEQLLKVSDLESRLDQLRFEPSPNAVTMTGLRSRIKSLTEELEEAKSQIHLRDMELSDLKEKVVANQALITKMSNTQLVSFKHDYPRVSAETQTNLLASANLLSRTKNLDFAKEVGVQTSFKFPVSEFDSQMDVSHIPRTAVLFHSTPTEDVTSNSKRSKPISSFSKFGDGLHFQGSPEALREHIVTIRSDDEGLESVLDGNSGEKDQEKLFKKFVSVLACNAYRFENVLIRLEVC